MLRRIAPLALLALGALACSLTGSGAPTTAPDALASSVAATLTALAPQGASATPSAAPGVTQAPAASSTPAGEASATVAAPATEAATAATEATSEPGATVAPTEATAPTEAIDTGCKLAYADQDTLYCLPDSGTPRTLATGAGLFGPALSPDGALIAYQVVVTEDVTQLWVASVSEGGAEPHMLVGQDQLPGADASQINSPNHYAWLAGTHTLIFDTRIKPTGGPGEWINADLWKVDADSSTLAALLPAGQAGAFSVSPNGHSIAISRGTGLDLVNVDGSNPHANVVSFPAIVTYSEYTFKPRPQWAADGSYFTVAIPSIDPLAADSSVAFYHVTAEGVVTPYGTQPGNYVFGGLQPQIAPDGAHLVFSRNDAAGGPDDLHMLTLAPDAVADDVFDQQANLVGWGWGPDSQPYVYSAVPSGGGGKAYVSGPGVEMPHVFAEDITALKELRWVNGNTVVFLGQISGSAWSLYRTGTGEEPGSVETLILGLTEQTSFDVRP